MRRLRQNLGEGDDGPLQRIEKWLNDLSSPPPYPEESDLSPTRHQRCHPPRGEGFSYVGRFHPWPSPQEQTALPYFGRAEFFYDSRNHQAFTAPLVRPEMNLLTGFLLSGSDKE